MTGLEALFNPNLSEEGGGGVILPELVSFSLMTQKRLKL